MSSNAFEIDEDDDVTNSAQKKLTEFRRQKSQRSTIPTRYRSFKHVLPTTNIVERRAKIVMTDLRQSMTPRNLELLMMLRVNRFLWDVHTVEAAIADVAANN